MTARFLLKHRFAAMRSILAAIFGGVLSWWGLCLIAALDSTMFFFLPLGVDAAVVLLAARHRELFWLYPILASTGSILGASITYYIGRRAGEAGLKWFVRPDQMKRFRTRIENKGAVALAVLDLLPPPFPFTACVLVAGAAKVDAWLFFVTLFVTRLLRFGGEAVLAYFYGRHIVRWLTSDTFEYIGITVVLVMIVGSAIATIQVVRKSRGHRRDARTVHAA